MLKTLITTALVAATLMGGAATAEAASRHVTAVGPNGGTYDGSLDRYCVDGACYSERQIIGPNGSSVASSGKCTLVATHTWNCVGTVTGPKGGSRSGSATVTFN